MNKTLSSAIITFFGIITSILSIWTIYITSEIFETNFYTFTVLFIIPVGAILTGALAASGYYFGYVLFQRMPDRSLFFQTIGIAAVTQIAIYLANYKTSNSFNGKPISDLIDFSTFLNAVLTHAEYKMRLGASSNFVKGTVGIFGYFLAIVYFLGFLFGGVWIYMALNNKAACLKCSRYLYKSGEKRKAFPTVSEFSNFYEDLYKYSIESDEFKRAISHEYNAKSIPSMAKVHGRICLLKCPSCAQERVVEKMTINELNDWNKELREVTRITEIEHGKSIEAIFKKGSEAQ